MNKRLQGRFREVIHKNYILYYFVYMYAQICDENALIWGFHIAMIPVKAPPIILCTALYIIFIC